MKDLSLERMAEVHGGDWCTFSSVMLAGATIFIFAAPFTGGISLGLLAFVTTHRTIWLKIATFK